MIPKDLVPHGVPDPSRGRLALDAGISRSEKILERAPKIEI
jgi:hypothetical protein